MKTHVWLIALAFTLISHPSVSGGRIDALFEFNACTDARVADVSDAESAYLKATKLINEGRNELGELYMACSIYKGGGAYLYNAGFYYRGRGDSRALDYFLAASALGVDNAEQAAGDLLLKDAKSERERLLALAFLSSSLKECHGTALLDYRDEALRSKAAIALMEAYAWTKVRLSRSQGIPGAIATYTTWLNEYSELMNDRMRELAEKRAAIVIDKGLDCSDRRKRQNDGGPH